VTRVYAPKAGYEHLGPTTSDDYEQPPFRVGQHVLYLGKWYTVVEPGEVLTVTPLMGGESRTVSESSVRGSWRRR
jgi:hypothetical protein